MAKILILSAFVFISLFTLAAAEDSLYKAFSDMLTGTYLDNVSDLPPATNLHPDETLQYGPSSPSWEDRCEGDSTNNCVYGWLDIVGFKNSVLVGDTYYIKGDPASSAIVQYKTYVRINGRYLLGGWKYDLQKYVSNGILTAKMDATAILYQIDQSGSYSYANETRTFYRSAPVPVQYPQLLSNSSVYITVYNVPTQVFLAPNDLPLC